jgi:hypothetical protein
MNSAPTLRSRTAFKAQIAATFEDPAAIQSSLDDVELPKALAEWLGRLRLLKGLPFNYLVPDEGMLPPESIRFFYLDMNWVDALLDGAFSIGRNLTATENAATTNLDRAVMPAVHQHVRRRVTNMRAKALGMAAPEATLQVVSGFLLRSSVVSAYKGIGANVFPLGGTPEDEKITLLNILRFEALGPNSDTLLCLVDGDAYRVDVHEAPEHLHYGIDKYEFDHTNGVTALKMIHTFSKSGSQVTLTGNTSPLDLSGSFRSNSPRVLKMVTLAGQIAALNNVTDIDSAEMGFEMTEGVGMVSFMKKSL